MVESRELEYVLLDVSFAKDCPVRLFVKKKLRMYLRKCEPRTASHKRE